MSIEEVIHLDCPLCKEEISRPLVWFKSEYVVCPSCGGGLRARQFEALIAGLEAAWDKEIETMLTGEVPEENAGCSCGGCGCSAKPKR